MAVTPTHIPTEILRLLTAQEAAEYRLVPFAREAGRIRCYGETGHDYTAAAEELEVLYGWQVEVVPIAADDLQRLLLQHYRPGAQTASAAAGRTAEIGQGRQFLFALVGEALRDNASDIHLEPYEQRCRIRLMGGSDSADSDPSMIRIIREAATSVPWFREELIRDSAPGFGSDDACVPMAAVQKQGGNAAYLMLGSRLAAGHHAPDFDFHEEVLLPSVALLTTVVLALDRD